MKYKLQTSEIANLSSFFQNELNICFAYLFGSRAKGYANEKSDLDIGIFFYHFIEDEKNPWYIFTLESKLSHLIGYNTQIVVLNNIESEILGFHIISEGILIIEKDKNKRIEFETCILRRYQDWQYFLQRHILSEKHQKKEIISWIK
jgi:predicted nucleotidyltransferase